MVKEPQNIYDPNAIAVQTLAGQHLGYVPKEHTDRFPHDVTFGHIYSLGPNALGLWGVTVCTLPHAWRIYATLLLTCHVKSHAVVLCGYWLLGTHMVRLTGNVCLCLRS